MVRDYEDANMGLNCVALIHLIYKEIFNICLPPDLRAVELYFPNDYFDSLDLSQAKVVGDIVFMARDGINEVLKEFVPIFSERGDLLNKCPFHLAMYIGKGLKNDSLFIHANYIDKKVAIWSEQRILSYIRYSAIFALRRSKLLTSKFNGNSTD